MVPRHSRVTNTCPKCTNWVDLSKHAFIEKNCSEFVIDKISILSDNFRKMLLHIDLVFFLFSGQSIPLLEPYCSTYSEPLCLRCCLFYLSLPILFYFLLFVFIHVSLRSAFFYQKISSLLEDFPDA